MAKKRTLDLVDQSAPLVSVSLDSNDRNLTREERRIVETAHTQVVAQKAYYAKGMIAQELHGAVEHHTVRTFAKSSHAINAVAQEYRDTEVGGYVDGFAHQRTNHLASALGNTADRVHSLINEEVSRSVYIEKKRGWFG